MIHKNHSTRIFLLATLFAFCAAPAVAQFVITTPDLPSGTVGQFYSATLQTFGGVPPISFSILSGSLPPGISLNSSGSFTGAPTSGGFYNFTVRAVDSSVSTSQVATKAFSIYVYPVITVLPATLPSVIVNVPINIQLSASGGVAPYYFQFDFQSIQPPAWLSLSSSGLLGGTPPAQGTFTFGVWVWDQTESSVQKTYTLTVGAGVAFTTSSLPVGVVGQAYSTTLAASGGTPPYTFSIVQGSLPAGVTLNSNGVLSGIPTTAGSTNFTARVTASAGGTADRSFTLTVQPPPIDFTPTVLPPGAVNTPYSASFTATGVGSSYAFSVLAGSLPPGLALSSLGTVSGTPSSAGAFSFTVRLSHGNFNVDKVVQITIEVQPLVFQASTLPDGVTGQAYSATLMASGGAPPYSFAVSGGNPPPGLSLGSGGSISGAPTASGTYGFTVTVSDTGGRRSSGALAILVLDPLALGPEALPPARLSEAYSLQLQPSGGKPPYSFALSGNLPPGVNFSGGVFNGTPTAPGVHPLRVTLTDTAGRSLERSYRLVVPSNIQISAAAPLPQGTVGQDYSTTFTASGGIAPYSWSSTGTLPGGLALNPSTGVLSGRPASAGEFSFGIRVEDITESPAVRAVNVTIGLPPLPPVVFTQIGSTVPPAQQPTFGLRINQAYPAPIAGVVRLTFAPDRFGDDPAVLFSNGSRTVPFTIPAGQQDANFGSTPAALQTGTVAGTITLTSSISVGGADVTPSPAPQQTIRVAPAAPVITKLELNRVPGGFELVVTGYSTPRQLTQAVVKLTPTSGSAIATSEFPIALDSVLNSYYGSSASAPFGSQFRLVIPFFVPQGLTGLASASVTLTNPVGSSSAVSVNF